MKFLKYTFSFLLFTIAVCIIIFNSLLFYQPKFSKHGSQNLNDDLLKQLSYLQIEIHKGAPHEMQQLFPEGFVFLNSLYALSWIEIAEELQPGEKLYSEALEEVNWIINELESPFGKKAFDEEMELPYGVFYNGWYNYVLGRRVNLTINQQLDSIQMLKFKRKCDEIISALNNSKSPYLESYLGACWPADMTVAMASIAVGNKIFPGRYQIPIDNWIKNIESRTDHLGLMPHSVLAQNGNVAEPSRGSSQSLILNFLIDIDSAYAAEKFETFRSNFLDYRLGLPGIREYPFETVGYGDIDSGPVIWDIGGAASIVGQRVMAIYKDQTTAIGLRNSIEVFGLAKIADCKKTYLFGMLPMADGFIAWSNSIESNESNALWTSGNWLVVTQLISFGVIAVCALGIYAILKKANN